MSESESSGLLDDPTIESSELIRTTSMPGLIVLRFFCGVFASSGPALGVATCADVSSGMQSWMSGWSWTLTFRCGRLKSAVAQSAYTGWVPSLDLFSAVCSVIGFSHMAGDGCSGSSLFSLGSTRFGSSHLPRRRMQSESMIRLGPLAYIKLREAIT